MKKIGIILDSLHPSKYLYQTIYEISQNDNIELYYLLNKNQDVSFYRKVVRYFKGKSFFRSLELICFRLVCYVEFKVISFFNKNLHNLDSRQDISSIIKNDIILLDPIFSPSGIVVKYPKENIEKIKSLNLDMILRGDARGIFRGEILDCTKKGMISFHHGDNRWNRGGPAGFWEVFLKKRSTGFVIQFLKSKLDGGSIIFRGNISTKRTYTENQFNLYNISNPYMAKIINEYADTDYLPDIEKSFDFNLPILKAPSITKSLKYSLYFFKHLLFKILKNLYRKTSLSKYFFKNRNHWGIAFINKNLDNLNLSEGIKVKNPKNRYFADPFVIKKHNQTVCFVEDYSVLEKRGRISAIEILNNQQYKLLGPIIEEDFHMSYPFIFEYKNEIYMTPETADANSLRLYKCSKFPLKWEFQKEIITNEKVIDPIIFQYKDKWWLFYNTLIEDDPSSCLVAYYSDNPLSNKWIPHKLNPIVFDSSSARNGGIIFKNNNEIMRVRQKQGFNFYGESLSLAQIVDLTPSTFKEEKVKEVLPNFFSNISGCHHMHNNYHYTVYDYFCHSSFI